MNESATPAIIVAIKQQKRVTWGDILVQYTKGLVIIVINVTIK